MNSGTGTARLAEANGIEICYEILGDPADEPMLLVMGLGVQMIGWEPEFCGMFVREGFRVVRFDNRDTGLSTKFDGTSWDLETARTGDPAGACYSLEDMADDVAGLLDALGLPRVHLVGASMGGMIAQTVAIRHPGRVLSLASIMSTTGNRAVGGADPEALAAISAIAPDTRPDVIAAAVDRGRVVAGGGFPFDADMLARRAALAFDRAHFPMGKARQQAAILTAADRTQALRALRVPAVVIHGDKDPVISVSGGYSTADAIPDSHLVVIAGMGHEIPLGARRQVVDAIVANARRASRAPGSD